jgi:hypothetical protein
VPEHENEDDVAIEAPPAKVDPSVLGRIRACIKVGGGDLAARLNWPSLQSVVGILPGRLFVVSLMC